MSRFKVSSFRDFNPVVVGIVAVVVGALGVSAAFVFGTVRPFESSYAVTAVFESTGGLKANAEVRLAGVDVGRVTGVRADFERGQVIVSMAIDEGIDLGPEMTAQISAATLLGGNYVRLEGRVEEPYLASLPSDDRRRRIPLDRTRAPVSLVQALSDTTSAVEAIDIDAVNQVLSELAGATDRNRDVVPRIIESLTTVGAAIAARDAELERLVANGRQISEALAARDDQIVALIDAAAVLLDTLQQRRDELAALLGSGSDAVVTLTETITEHRAAIDALLADAHVLLDGVGRNLSTINTTLAYAGPLFSLLANTINPSGGFDVAIEGFVVSVDQFRGLLGILFPSVVPGDQ